MNKQPSFAVSFTGNWNSNISGRLELSHAEFLPCCFLIIAWCTSRKKKKLSHPTIHAQRIFLLAISALLQKPLYSEQHFYQVWLIQNKIKKHKCKREGGESNTKYTHIFYPYL